jgi:hypothetical protein
MPLNTTGMRQVVCVSNLRRVFRQLLAADALVVTLNSSSQLALALSGWLFVELACAQFGQQTGFSMVRLKRRIATSNGSFSLRRIVVM